MKLRTLPVLLTALAGGLALTALPGQGQAAEPGGRPAAAAPLAGLKVLIANDDSAQGRDTRYGTDGRGLYTLRSALCAAGADVVVVAPWSQQSGAGGRMTPPGSAPVAITVQKVTAPAAYAGDCAAAPSGGPVYGVCVGAAPCTSTSPSASPADAVMIGLDRVVPDHYWSEGPDVVLSGINFGQNVGTLINHSGTVGAAITAHEHGVATLALSAEVSFADLAATQFVPAADFTVDLLGRLVRRDLLTPDLALNVNVPFLEDPGTPLRPALTAAGTSADIDNSYTGAVGIDGGTYRLVVGPATPETRRDADTDALKANRVSVTPLDGDYTAGGRASRVNQVLAGW
ncbi:5'/3'-nucleotidase SurE [Nocardioides ginsengisoli]|uniref:5'-nucleotidase n=1 Tax=Nocardioides ginsengisoli TaxID=363868 RepID=A0ABW3W5P1_9ACTN